MEKYNMDELLKQRGLLVDSLIKLNEQKCISCAETILKALKQFDDSYSKIIENRILNQENNK